MFTIHATEKLRTRLAVAPIDVIPASTTLLGNWYANVHLHHRKQVVLFISERTLLPVVVPVAPTATLVERFGLALGELLVAIGIDPQRAEAEQREMRTAAFAKTSNRRVLGSMKDFAWLLDAAPANETLLNAARVLAAAPCSPIAWDSPQTVTTALFAGAANVTLVQ
jgi:hypothetical protein